MKRIFQHSSNKLPIRIALILFLVLSLSFSGMYFYESKKQEREALFNMQNQAKIISLLTQDALAQYESDRTLNLINLQNISESMANLKDVMWLEIFDKNSNVIAHSNKERVGSNPLPLHASYVRQIMKTGKHLEELDQKNGRFNHFSPYYIEVESSNKSGKSTRINGVLELVLKSKSGSINHLQKYADTLIKMATSIVERNENQNEKNLEHLKKLTNVIGHIEGVKFVEIYDNQAKLMARTNALQDEIVENELIGDVKKMLQSGASASLVNISGERYSYLTPFHAYELSPNGSKKIAGVVNVTMDLNRVNAIVGDTKKNILLLLLFLALGIAALLYVVLTKIINQHVSDIKSLQAAMVNASRLSNLGEVASGIAHEINNPLMIIMGRSEQFITQFRSGELSRENGIEQLEKIITTSKRIATVVRGLKEFSRNADQDPYEQIELKKLLENILNLCFEKFKSHKITLEVGNIPNVIVNCRVIQIQQEFLNILNNAYDAVVASPVKWIRIDFNMKNKILEISITDSGEGVPPHVVSKLMQPFFTTKEVGKGMGLSISKGIFEDHNGQLYYDVTSKVTRFVIEISYQ